MPLSFLTQDHRFIFVDQKTHQIIHPMNMFTGVKYDVYVVAMNQGPEVCAGVKARAWHSGIGQSKFDELSGLVQPIPFEVPAAVYGVAGQATIAFQFSPRRSGRGTLHVRLEPGGPMIRQDVSVHEPLERLGSEPPDEKRNRFLTMSFVARPRI